MTISPPRADQADSANSVVNRLALFVAGEYATPVFAPLASQHPPLLPETADGLRIMMSGLRMMGDELLAQALAACGSDDRRRAVAYAEHCAYAQNVLSIVYGAGERLDPEGAEQGESMLAEVEHLFVAATIWTCADRAGDLSKESAYRTAELAIAIFAEEHARSERNQEQTT